MYDFVSAGGGAVPMPGAVLAPVAPPAAYRHDGPGMTKALKRITITFTPADAPGTTGATHCLLLSKKTSHTMVLP